MSIDMEFNEKLQELRKLRGLTQEELATALYVTRTAISKWESGKGYPSIDSIKDIAKFFDVTIDQLLSSNQLLLVAENDTRQTKKCFFDLIFGLLDLSIALLFFLPFFAVKSSSSIENVSLISLYSVQPYIKIAYYSQAAEELESNKTILEYVWDAHQKLTQNMANYVSEF